MAETYQVSVKKVRVKGLKGKTKARTDTYVVVKTPDGTIGLNTNVRSGVSYYQLPGKEKKIRVPELAGQRINAKGVLERKGKEGALEHYKMPLVKKDMTAIAHALRMSYEPKSVFRRKKKAKA